MAVMQAGLVLDVIAGTSFAFQTLSAWRSP